MIKLNKNLLLVDYQLDNLHNINQIKLDNTIVSFITDFDNLDNNLLEIVNNNEIDRIGILHSLESSEFINSTINKIKNISNVLIVEFINSENYNTYLNISYKYNNDTLIFDYAEAYIIELKYLSASGGFFYLTSLTPDIKYFIHNENGDINFKYNNIGIFNITVNYKIYNLIISKNINITIKPLVNYNINTINIVNNIMYNSDKPIITPSNLNGNFILEEKADVIPFVTIDSLEGDFNFQNPKIGDYDINILYNVNNIIVKNVIKINVIPLLKYESYYEVKYGNILYIDAPIIDNKYVNGLFNINTLLDLSNEIEINNEGSIIFNKNKKLETNNYEININYQINDNLFETTIKILILPNIIYTLDALDNLYEGKTLIISKPLLNSDTNVQFILNDLNLDAFINKNNGLITIKNIEAGEYILHIKVVFKQLFYNEKLLLIVKPYIDFEDNIKIIYDNIKIITFNYYNNFGDIVIKDQNNINYSLKNNIFEIDKSFLLNKYNFSISYTKNFITIEKILKVIIEPKITYDIKNIVISENIFINSPNVSHTNGIFYSSNNDIKINNDGSININKPIIKTYNLNYKYKLDDVVYNKLLTFSIIPFIEYEKDLLILYGNNFLINKPKVSPNTGIFTTNKQTNNNNIIINSDGSINLTNELFVNTYFINVNYTIEKLVTQISLNFVVKPHILYEKNIIFDRNNKKPIKPIFINPPNGIFCINNNLLNKFIIDKSTGEIYVDNSINIDLYNIEISYTVNNISNTFNLEINVCPNVVYNDTFLNIKYGEKYNIKEPTIEDTNGIFYFENNVNGININEKLGNIIISDLIKPNIYNLNIIYKLNNSYKIIPFTINVTPIINYNSKDINYGLISQSDKPFINPEGGLFTIIYNKNINIDTKTGIIYFLSKLAIGNYNVLIKYIYNNIYTEYTYSFNVVPHLIYDDEYNFITDINIKPKFINPRNGNFSINHSNFSINKNGEIKKIVDDYGSFNLLINYNHDISINKHIKINIIPDIYYENTSFNYKDPILVIPKINTNKGSFYFANVNNYFNINNITGYITSNSIIPVDDYNIDIIYKLDDITINKTLNIIIKPILINDPNNPKVESEPSGGYFRLDIDYPNINIDSKNGNLLLGDNLELGLHKLNIIYNYNNIEVNKNISINKKLFLFYTNIKTIIKGVDYLFEPTVNYSSGIYKLIDNINITGVVLDKITGNIKINNDINLGKHLINVEYKVNNYEVKSDLEFIVLPPFNYKLPLYEIEYGDELLIEPLIVSFLNNFNISNNINNIQINPDSGIIKISNLDVNNYNLDVNCFFNNELLNTRVQIIIKPSIKYSESLINIKYGNSYKSSIPKINPNNGIFSVNTNIINLNEDGSFTLPNNIDVNVYYFDIFYEINNIKTSTTIKLIINPIFEYKYNLITFEENNEYYTESPIYYPKEGIFILVNPPKGIILKDNGIIYIPNNLLIGSYNLSILYKVNNINLTNTLNIKILPKFYYGLINIDDYNKNFIAYYIDKNINIRNFNNIFKFDKLLKTNKPTFNNKGHIDIKNGINNISINGDDGIITFKNIDVGTYSFNINYHILNVDKTYNYQVLIVPSIKYESSIFNIKFNNNFKSLKPSVYPVGGVFYFLDSYNNIEIDYNSGELTVNNSISIDIYEITIFYEINNMITYTDIKIIIYPNTFIDNLEITYNEKIKLPIINYYKSNYKILNLNTNKFIDYTINNNIIELPNENIGLYNYRINADYNNIDYNIYFNVKIIAVITYKENIYEVLVGNSLVTDKPSLSYNDDSGYFEIVNKIKGITIDRITGEVHIYDKLAVKNYLINILYTSNEIITPININIIVKPVIVYSTNYYEINYGILETISNIPKAIPSNGTYSIDNDNFSIDTNGVISLNNKCDVNNYTINVIYEVNSVKVITSIIVKILPILTYDEFNMVIYGENSFIKPTKIEPSNYIVKSKNIIDNIILDENTGIINILSTCEPNIYKIDLCYSINNITVETSIDLIVDIYNINHMEYKTNHNSYDIIKLHNSNLKINYTVIDDANTMLDGSMNNKLFIKNNELHLKNLDVNTYDLKINYKINKIINQLKYTIIILPKLLYDDTYIFNYSEDILIKPINYSPINGTFKLINDYFNINRQGNITVKNSLLLGNYYLNIEYNVNKYRTNYKITIIIKPSIKYKELIYEGLHNDKLIINSPEYSPKNLNFSINPIGNINNIGVITLDKLDIGLYKINVKYDTSDIILDIIIKPVFFYIENKLILDYGINKILMPTVSQYEGKFFILEKYDGFILDEINGIIEINNLLPNNYNIRIYYEYRSIKVHTDVNIIVNPVLKYNNNNLLLKYKTETIIIVPTFSPLGGKFTANINLSNNNIYLDENNGNLIFDDTKVGSYKFNILYSFNNSKTSTEINFDILPVIIYDSSEYEFYNGIVNIIDKPYISPSGGKFYINGDSFIKYLKIDINGKIIINNELSLGIYEFYVIYDYNKITFSTKLIIDIRPYIFYENISIDYESNYTHIPLFLIDNHNINKFNILYNDRLNINNKGVINNFNNLKVGLHMIDIQYNCNNKLYETYFTCEILPRINIDLESNTINFYPEGGNIVYDDSRLLINNNKLVYKNVFDDNIVDINYIFNNINTILSLKIKSKPIKIFESEIIVTYGTIDKIESYVQYGVITSIDKPYNLYIEGTTLNIKNLYVGKYSFTVNYSINDLLCDQLITLLIKPNIFYKNESVYSTCNIGTTDETPTLDPPNGKLYIKNFIKGVSINQSGNITLFNVLPNIYDLTVCYSVNNIVSNTNIKLYSKPLLIIYNNEITIKYGEPIIITNVKALPVGGTFSSNVPIIFNKTLILEYLSKLSIGTNKVDIEYTYNKIITKKSINVIIEPIMNYLMKDYKINYGNSLIIDNPIISHDNGFFKLEVKEDKSNIINIDKNGIINIDKNGIINIDKNGIINIDKNVSIGKYILDISYHINEFIIKDLINVTVEPYFYYNQDTITLIHNSNNKVYSDIPSYYPKDGKFYLEKNYEHISINNDTGILEINNFDIGKYNIDILYKSNKTILKTNMALIINPSILYELSMINLKYKTVYNISKPIVSNNGGEFICRNLPKGFILSKKTGVININYKEYADINFYNLIISYNINNLTTTTNIYVNIT